MTAFYKAGARHFTHMISLFLTLLQGMYCKDLIYKYVHWDFKRVDNSSAPEEEAGQQLNSSLESTLCAVATILCVLAVCPRRWPAWAVTQILIHLLLWSLSTSSGLCCWSQGLLSVCTSALCSFAAAACCPSRCWKSSSLLHTVTGSIPTLELSLAPQGEEWLTSWEAAEWYQRVFRTGGGTDPTVYVLIPCPFHLGYAGAISTTGKPVRTSALAPQCQRPEMSQRCHVHRLKQKFRSSNDGAHTWANASSVGTVLWWKCLHLSLVLPWVVCVDLGKFLLFLGFSFSDLQNYNSCLISLYEHAGSGRWNASCEQWV